MNRADQRDWWYGASAAFPRAVEWHTWFRYWQERYDASQPVDRFLVDATMKLQQVFVQMGRELRKNLGFTRLYSEDEMRTILDVAEGAEAWFSRNAPRKDQLEALDPRLGFLFQALTGAYAVASALAREQDQINRRGYVLVDTGAESTELNNSAVAS